MKCAIEFCSSIICDTKITPVYKHSCTEMSRLCCLVLVFRQFTKDISTVKRYINKSSIIEKVHFILGHFYFIILSGGVASTYMYMPSRVHRRSCSVMAVLQRHINCHNYYYYICQPQPLLWPWNVWTFLIWCRPVCQTSCSNYDKWFL